MTRPTITIAWSNHKGEASVSVSSAWKELHWIEQMDGLADALHDLTDLYNETLKQNPARDYDR